MDLDSALDDIIRKKRPAKSQKKTSKPLLTSSNKKSKQRPARPVPPAPPAPAASPKYQSRQKQRQPASNKPSILARLGRHGVQSQSKTSMKQSQRLSTPLARKSTISKSSSADPSHIMITKHVDNRNKEVESQYREQDYVASSVSTTPVRQDPGFSFRGLSAPATGFSIRGESGPASVLISNLDREANAADIKTACSQFGDVISCEVFYDRNGRSVGEAEVEFATKVSALDCIAKLDNEQADGRTLRVTLREKPTRQYKSEIHSVLATNVTYPPSGKMYADHIESTSRYGVQSSGRRY